jgi:glycerol uptake facilitator-like aquaporin
MALRAGYGEFMCTFLFFTPILGTIANTSFQGLPSSEKRYLAAFVGGFQAIAVSFAFSSVSGAHFNPAISFALWITGKLSNRKCILYIFVQFLASILSMAVVATMFDSDDNLLYEACVVKPVNDRHLGNVFATEFFLTFIFTYVAFTVVYSDAESAKKESMSFQTLSDSKGLTLYASTPQSKTGFAPFSIGFTIFSLSLIGGESGGAFNPARMLGPAIFSGVWDYLYLYWFAQLLGSSCAALLVQLMFKIGLKAHRKNETSAIGALTQVTPGILEKKNKELSDINPILSKEV